MTDDSLQADVHTIVQRGIALADCSYGGEGDQTGPTMSDPAPASAIVPTKITSSADVMPQILRTMEHLDVTDGNWTQLPLYMGTHIDPQTGSVSLEKKWSLRNFTMDSFLGVPNSADKGGSSVDKQCRVTYTQNNIGKYLMGRLKEVEVTLGNFMVTVERASSGGIQMKDNPMFQVQVCPIRSYHAGDSFANPGYPNSTYLTDLKEGIKAAASFDSGLFYLNDLVYKYDSPNPPKIKLYTYGTLRDFIMNGYPDNIEDRPKNLPPRVQMKSPLYRYWVRMVNVPRGVTDIKVYLSYTSQVRAHWFCTQWMEEALPLFPYMGGVIPAMDAARHIAHQYSPRDIEHLHHTITELMRQRDTLTAQEQERLLDGPRGRKRAKTEQHDATTAKQ